MGLLDSKTRSVVGLDIEPGFLAATEFSSGASPELVRAATETLGPGLFHEGEVVDVDGLADRVRAFFREHDLPKRIRLGVASQKIALRVLELPVINNEQELEAAVRFQAQEELPMPLEQAVLDYRVLERIDNGEGGKMRVVVVGARRDTVEHLLAVARKAGLQPEFVDLSAFAMIRALYIPPGPEPEALASAEVAPLPEVGLDGEPVQPLEGAPTADTAATAVAESGEQRETAATLYCYVGGLTNLAIGVGQSCVFNRVLQNGVESMAATLAERRGLTLDHSREWLRYVGLNREIDGLEGEREIIEEAREVLSHGVTPHRRRDPAFDRVLPHDRSRSPPCRDDRDGRPRHRDRGPRSLLRAGAGHAGQPRSMGQVEVKPGALDGVEASELTVATGLALDEVPEMRPINLIPVEQRRGAARGPGGRSDPGVYALLGGLGAAVVCVLAFVLMSNSVNTKTEQLADMQAKAQGEKQVADALRPYGQFADMQRARHQQINALTSGRFDWERALRQLSLAIPRNVYLLNVSATGSPDVEIERRRRGGDLANVRDKVDAPGLRDDRLHLLAARRRPDDDAHAKPRRRYRGDAREVGAHAGRHG